MKIENPGKRNYELNRIAQEAQYRDQAKLEQVYVDHTGFEKTTVGSPWMNSNRK